MASPGIVEQIMEVLSDPMNLPSAFWDYATQSWLKDAPVFPISQVFGFTQFTAQNGNFVNGNEATSLVTYGDLGTVGPQVTGLADGKYVAFFGGANTGSPGVGAYQNIQVNSDAIDETTSAYAFTNSSDTVTVATAKAVTCANGGNNAIRCVYRSQVGGTTVHFSARFLVVLKSANV